MKRMANTNEMPADLERQLTMAVKNSHRNLVCNFDDTETAFAVLETGEPNSFCSSTISWYNKYLRIFNTAVVIVVVFCTYVNSFIFFFESNQYYYNLGILADIMYTFMMFLRSRTASMVDGVEERNLLKVRERYQTSVGFFLDIVSMLPIALLAHVDVWDEGMIYIIDRQKTYLRLHYVLYYLGIREEEPGSSTFKYRSLKFLLLSSLVIHFTACGWYGVACARNGQNGFELKQCNSESWISHVLTDIILQDRYHLLHEPIVGTAANQSYRIHDSYVYSLYWATATACSTGYGDVHAYTLPEKIFSVMAMLLGMGFIFGMTLGGMTSMLTNIDAQRGNFIHRHGAFKNELENMKLSKEVKDICLRYFDYIWHKEKGESVEQSGVLEILPASLQAGFLEATFENLIYKADLLNATEPSFCRNLAQVAKCEVYLKNQYIQRSGEIASCMCLIKSGVVEVMDLNEQDIVAILHEGKLFGQVMLVYELPRLYSIRCKTNCEIFVITKDAFRRVLSEYPDAAKLFVDAAKKKCLEGRWPMTPPSFSDFNIVLEQASTRKRRMSIATCGGVEPKVPITSGKKLSTVMSGSDVRRYSRRMTTVYSTDYDGIDLPRIAHKKTTSKFREAVSVVEGKRPPLVEFVFGQSSAGHPGVRSSTQLADSTQLIASNADFDALKDAVGPQAKYKDPSDTTPLKRLSSVTLIDPESRFSRSWELYIFILTICNAYYCTFLFFFNTTLGKEITYTGDQVKTLRLLDIAENDCDPTIMPRLTECDRKAGLDEAIACIRKADGVFASMISGNATSGYNVTVPATWDVTLAGYNWETTAGILQILFSYFIIDLSYYINIYVNLRTVVQTQQGNLLTKFRDIWKNYFKWNRFGVDVVAAFPFEIFAPYLGCTRLAKYHNWIFLRATRFFYFIFYVPRIFRKLEHDLDAKIVLIRTMRIIIYVYMFTHLLGCCLYAWSCAYSLQFTEDRYDMLCGYGSFGWSFGMGYQSTRLRDYILSMYWVSSTMTSTGFGERPATTFVGQVYAMTTMYLGTIMYGWLVAVIASTTSNNKAILQQFVNAIQSLKQYLLTNGVPTCLVDRVSDCRKIEWQRYRGAAVPGEQAIGRELPLNLRGVLMYESVSKYVRGVPFFTNVDSSFISMMCNKVRTHLYSEGDVILHEGDLCPELYIIKQGHCLVVSRDLNVAVDHLRTGDYFGEIEVLFGCASPRTIVADTSCELLLLCREDIDEVLDSFPYLHAQIEKIEGNEEYKNDLLRAIESQMETGKEKGIDMRSRFAIHEITGGVSIYGRKTSALNVMQRVEKEGEEIRMEVLAGMPWLSRILCLFLIMPITFNPTSTGYLVYESIRVLLSIITVFIVPLQAAILPYHTGLLVVQYTADAFGMLDQYIKLHTMYYNDRKVLVRDPIRTALEYLKTGFLFDVLSWCPIEVIAMMAIPSPWNAHQWKFFAALRIMRMLQIFKIMQYFEFWLGDVRHKRQLLKNLTTGLYTLLLHHCMGCLLFAIASPPILTGDKTVFEDTTEWIALNATNPTFYTPVESWVGRLVNKDVLPAFDIVGSALHQYVVGVYWASSTLTCTGYGDVLAMQALEMVVATAIMIIGTIYFALILGNIAADIQMDDTLRGQYKNRLIDITKFFKTYHVEADTKKQVLDYYYYLWNRTQGVSPDNLLSGLSPSLKTSVYQALYDDMIREAFGLGTDNSGEDSKQNDGFFRLVSTRIKPCLYLGGSIICRRGEVGVEMYFIQRGNVAIFKEDDKTVDVVLGPGQYFGEIALLSASSRQRTATALTNCDLSMLSKNDLYNVLDKFPGFKSHLASIASDRSLNTHSSSYARPPSKADLTMEIVYDGEGNRKDGADKEIYSRVLDRESLLCSVWNHLTVIFAFLSSSLAVYQVAFQSHNSTLYSLGYLMDFWFAMDMLVCFHTTYLDQFSTNVDNRERVHLYYGKDPRKFLLDAVTNFPFDLFSHVSWISGTSTKNYVMKFYVLSYLRLIRVIRLRKMFGIFNIWDNEIRRDVLAGRMYRLVLSLFFVIHTFSCIWYFLACPDGTIVEKSWVTASMTDYANKGVRGYHFLSWVDGCYWVVATMTSTGYGDIKPETPEEIVFSCCVMVTGKLLIGYILCLVAATLANDESRRVWYEERVTSLKHHMVDLKFTEKLREHVIQYYDYMWMRNQGIDVTKLFRDLPFSLRKEVFVQICRDKMYKVDLFKGCPEAFLQHICVVMTPTSYMPGEYISLQGDIRSEMYIVQRGVAEVTQRDEGDNEIPIRLVLEGGNFLSESVLTKVRRQYSLRARTYVDIFTLTIDKLREVVEYYPEARQIIIDNAKVLSPSMEI